MDLPFLQDELLSNTVLSWLAAALTTLVVLAALRRSRTVVVRRLKASAERTGSHRVAELSKVVTKTHFLLLVVVAIWAGSQWLTVPQQANELFFRAAMMAVLIQVGIWGNSFVPILVGTYVRHEVMDAASRAVMSPALTFFGRLVLWALIVIVGLENLGVQVSALVASLGVGGVAVALASQSILGDLFASISILFDRPFVIDDYIAIDDLEGNVEKIGLRTTHIRSLGGEQLVFSNTDLLSSRIRNMQRMRERRILFTLNLVYSTPFEKLSRIPDMLKEIIEKEEGVRFDRAHFKTYADSSLNFEVVYWVTNREYRSYMDAQQRINFDIYERFEKEGIEFAYPTQTLHVAQDAGNEKGSGG